MVKQKVFLSSIANCKPAIYNTLWNSSNFFHNNTGIPPVSIENYGFHLFETSFFLNSVFSLIDDWLWIIKFSGNVFNFLAGGSL